MTDRDGITSSLADVIDSESGAWQKRFSQKLTVRRYRKSLTAILPHKLPAKVISSRQEAVGASSKPRCALLCALAQSPTELSLSEVLERATSAGPMKNNEQPSVLLITTNIVASLGIPTAEIRGSPQTAPEEPLTSAVEPGIDKVEYLFPTEKYQYYHLETSMPIVRMLRIEPGEKVDPIFCTLHHVDLSASLVPCEAVSYVCVGIT